MKAEVTINELRVGNLVHLIADGHENEPDLVNWIVDDFEFYQNRMKDIQPIPLTEEWLLKFGFQDRFLLCDNHKIDYEITERSEIIFWLNENGINLEFVHQLQNLYFALTGEELTIKTK